MLLLRRRSDIASPQIFWPVTLTHSLAQLIHGRTAAKRPARRPPDKEVSASSSSLLARHFEIGANIGCLVGGAANFA